MSTPKNPLETIVATKSANSENAEAPKKQFSANDFVWKEKLGKGAFGTVFRCFEKKNIFYVAVKCVKKTMLVDDRVLLQFIREIELQRVLIHKNIVTLYAFFQNERYAFIVLELCTNGTLSNLLRREKHLAVSKASYYADCIADALDYCHVRNVIHRDLKPANILINDKLEPKLADFGFAVHYDVKFKQQTLCGTPSYLSPEMLNDDTNHAHTAKVDNWGLGVLFYECLTGHTPFRSPDQLTTYTNIAKARIEEDSKVPDDALTMIKGLLTVNVDQRLELKEFRSSAFILAEVQKYESARN